MGQLKRFLIGLVLTFFSLSAWSSEAALRAAFVFNFIKFIEWPQAVSSSTFHLCVLGGDAEVNQALESLRERSVTRTGNDSNGANARKQTIDVIYLANSPTFNTTLNSCQMLYRPRMNSTGSLPVPLPQGLVLVADEVVGNDNNISIAMHLNEEGHIEFSINPAAVNRAGVVMSSQLLKLAKNSWLGNQQ